MLSSKRHFTAVIGKKEQGSYVSSSPSSAARKAVSKLCADNKNRKVKFSIRETTQGSKKKTYGPYIGYMQKLEGCVIRYNPVAKLDKKDSKMKGGVIIGRGIEGFVLQPNINNPSNSNLVSKLIQIDDTRLEKLKSFESKLNEIDPSGKYHIPMIIKRSRRINLENINRSNLDEHEKQQLRLFNPNYKITYEFGGISIMQILKNYKIYSHLFNDNIFFKNFLLGMVNIIEGLLKFYENGIYHSDLHEGNIVFSLDNPEIMRLIDWGYLLENRNHNTASYKLNLNLYSFFEIISDFLKIEDISEKVSSIFTKILDIKDLLVNNNHFQNRFVIIKEKMLEKIKESFPELFPTL